MLSFIILFDLFFCYAECHYEECHYAECHTAHQKAFKVPNVIWRIFNLKYLKMQSLNFVGSWQNEPINLQKNIGAKTLSQKEKIQ